MDKQLSSQIAPPALTSPTPKFAADASPEASGIDVQARERGVTFRVVVLSLLLAVVFGYIIPIIDIKLGNTYLGSVHMPPGAIAVMLVMLLVINPLLKLLSLRMAFSRNEILTVYITSLFACLVPGHGAENFFVSIIIAPFYFATQENGWLSFLQEHLQPWFTPGLADGGLYGDVARGVVEPWFISGQSVPWGAWLVPLVAWGAFIFSSYIMLGCLSVMLRAQWAEREALAFPLLSLPTEMSKDADESNRTGGVPRFFRNPLMWLGFAVAVFIQLVNGLNLYYPNVPIVPLGIDTGQLFNEVPWNQMAPMAVRVMPMIVGLTFLLTSEVALSLWFFLWVVQGEYILSYYLGYMPSTLPGAIGHVADGGAKTFIAYQQLGAFATYVVFICWIGREHFGHIVRRAFRRAQATPEEKREALSYPVAFWGFILSFAFMLGWSVAAGVRLDVALVLWTSYLVAAMVLTRVTVEGGLFYAQQSWTPLGLMAQLTGSGAGTWLAPSSLVPATFLQASMITDMRAFLMPSFVHCFKLAYDRKIDSRRLLALIFGVILITLVMGIVMRVKMGYESGGLSLSAWFANQGAQQPARNSQELINGAHDAGWINALWLGVGGIVTYSLMLARAHLLWFPLHPIGYLMALTTPIQRMWFSIFLGWLAKALITRFGGTDTYRKMIPAFLGLALGDVAMMLLWLLIDAWQGRTGHQLMPG